MLRLRHRSLLLLALVLAPLACDSKSPVEPAPAACTYTLSTASLTVGSQGGPNSVTVTTAANCAWSAASDRGWMTITGGSTGTGSGVVSVSLAPNPNEAGRTGTLTVAGKTVAVSQDGAGPCAIDISPSSASYNKDSVTGTFAVSAAAHCGWTATSNASWVAVTSGSPGTGNGTVAYSVERNRDVSPRTGTISVGERTFTVAQAGDLPGCEYLVSPSSLSFGAAGGSSSVTVAAGSQCAWNAVSDQAWVTIKNGAGSGGGTVQIAVAANPSETVRTATVIVAGHAVTVRQDGVSVSCQYSVSPVSLTFPATGGANSVTVATMSSCAWTAVSYADWVTITTGASGRGDGTVSLSATANPNETARSTTLTIAGQVVSVRQDAQAPCTIDIAPGSASYNNDPATGSIAVTAPAQCAWSATSNASWLTVTSGSAGTGSGSVAYAVARNDDAATRTGTIVVGARTFTVTQLGASLECQYSVTPVEFDACMAVPFNLMATITTQQGCTWTVTPDADWITLTSSPSGNGSGLITFRLSDNWDLPRQGVVKVRWPTATAGQNLQVSQAGCRYAVSNAAFTIAAAGGTGRFDVIQASDPNSCGGPLQNACLWTATSDVPWITITTSMPQRGDNPVNFTVSPNSSGVARTGRITVRDQVVVITQPGS